MSKLLKESSGPSDLCTRIGGLPTADTSFQWPTCKSCSGPMQFLGQVALDETGIPEIAKRSQTLLLFQCQSDPGMCDDWDPDGGGNCACLVPSAGAAEIAAPEGETTLPQVSACETFDHASDDGEDYLELLESENGADVIGRLGGEPGWIQGDETPACECGDLMSFVAQLEEAGGGGINFCDCGSGYAFICTTCPDKAKFLWQCS